MTIYHKFDFDRNTPSPGDVLISCNPSVMDGRVIDADGLTFERCNMFGVTPNPTWTMVKSAHYGKTKADLPPESTEYEKTKAKAEQLAIDLTELAEIDAEHASAVAEGVKGKWKPDKVSAVLSADGKAVKVESIDGSWL